MKLKYILAYITFLLFLAFAGVFYQFGSEFIWQKEVGKESAKIEAMAKFFAVSVLNLEELTEDETILLMGRQGMNVDTIMLARVIPESGRVLLISIPRDLYVEGKKINSFYGEHDLQKQLSVVTDVTGVKIDHYVLVDLEAFRDIIDLLGGIDVTLTADLVDPTYKVCNGEDEDDCSTLNYPAGTYHLNGTEALRVARSRHTTSDYDRAERQQIIISGVRDRLNDLSTVDIGKVFEIANTALSAVTTDLGFTDIMNRFFAYKGFGVEGKGVLSSGNVLAAVPVEVPYVTSRVEKGCEDESKPETCTEKYFIDTLQPRDTNGDGAGDFGTVRWYVQKALEIIE
ncbi:MAG: LCP family protein [Candidatus Gracilibacteria bacterium]